MTNETTPRSIRQSMNVDKLLKMAWCSSHRWKGKKKAVHKTTTTDDKRLQSTLKRIGVNAIPAIEEVNIFKDDVFKLLLQPTHGLTTGYSSRNYQPIGKLAEQFQKQSPAAGAGAATTQEEDDDDVPDLVDGQTFEAAAEEKTEKPAAS
ncbi:hypothetical protein JRO89_XS13G0238200 [Xanthoceras sorbifolium]|uniref:Nascent polypeptide-associated complex subunit beta n=1 Tax=Xanthoceras sorbifolium TaxID=99658 RepID=A0ABQ8H9R0_9ROSI|nr:hypothetical protein JRO89_XS13G0238200 [Xanthoceras sorbifolium]